MSSAEAHELIDAIIEALKVEPKQRSECIRTIYFRLRSAESLRRAYENPPGAQVRAAAALALALKKARKLMPKVEPLFSSIMYDDGGLSCFGDPLNRAIAAADRLATTVVVSDGKKPRNVDKWQAKLIAADLVAEFSPLAGKRATPRSMSTTATSGEPGRRGESGAIDDVAVLIYQILAGREGADLTDKVEAYAPPTTRTRTAGGPRPASQRASDLALALAELEEMRKLTTEEHVPHSPRRQALDAANAWLEEEKMRQLAEAPDATGAHRCKK